MKITATIRHLRDGRVVSDIRWTMERKSRSIYDDSCEDAWYAEYLCGEEEELPEVGETYMVAASSYVGPDRERRERDDRLLFAPDNGQGWRGNSDWTSMRYHGWRGTTNDTSIYALGVRRCLAVRKTGKRSLRLVTTYGRDLKTGED